MKRFLAYHFSGKNLLLMGLLLVLFILGFVWTLTQQRGDGNGWIMVICLIVFLFHLVGSYAYWRKVGRP